ncbi:uncharacterized protein LOC113237992 [Hyposmocoma kahamanoa]|uniref:uncharacterized protein LOC113237992 n=1 Tax=Hyposmocoma kahamanoa TaxID=1477025 RepID=UPI000E6D7BB5|nr:uncharacterized protein LOC113237992 [Hyposmocoma kahamanoa]
MQKNAAVLTVVCVMLCLTFNYTFPLHREMSGSVNSFYPNQTEQCNIPVHHKTIVERSKKMAANIEQAFKRIRDSTQDFGKNIYERVNGVSRRDLEKNLSSEDGLRHFEQLVIMKKNPYLDLKEVELEYRPSGKLMNVRQSLKFVEPSFRNDPGVYEPLEDGPNVEISNRGLSGFSIPSQLLMSKLTKESKDENVAKITTKSPLKDVLGSLNDDVRQYVDWKTSRNV